MPTTPTLPVDGVTTVNAALFATYRTAILELQAGGAKMQVTISQTAHGFAANEVLRYGSGSFAKARANLRANCIDVVGIVASVTDANTFVLHLGGQVSDLASLVANTIYYLSIATDGALTTTRPSSGYAVPIIKTTNDATVAYSLSMTPERAHGVVTKTGAYTLGETDVMVLGDATSAGFTLTLPSAATRAGEPPYNIKKIDSTSNAVTIDGDGAETIDGAATKALTIQYDSLSLISDGTNWHII